MKYKWSHGKPGRQQKMDQRVACSARARWTEFERDSDRAEEIVDDSARITDDTGMQILESTKEKNGSGQRIDQSEQNE